MGFLEILAGPEKYFWFMHQTAKEFVNYHFPRATQSGRARRNVTAFKLVSGNILRMKRNGLNVPNLHSAFYKPGPSTFHEHQDKISVQDCVAGALLNAVAFEKAT
jgi:hypothetical protein